MGCGSSKSQEKAVIATRNVAIRDEKSKASRVNDNDFLNNNAVVEEENGSGRDENRPTPTIALINAFEDEDIVPETTTDKVDTKAKKVAKPEDNSSVVANKKISDDVHVTPTTEDTIGLVVHTTNLVKNLNIEKEVNPGKRLAKCSLFASVEELRDIDSYALEAPKCHTSSFEDLAKYLTGPFDSDFSKVRSIWRWVTANISYDTDAFFKNDLSRAADEGNALRTGKAVCSGYSSLVLALCSCSGIECKEIHGYAKGYNYQVGHHFKGERSNHSWNAVKIDNQWWLLDFTWGAGYVGNDKKFMWHYTDHYFMTNPEEFILDHFPIDEEWQMITPTYPIEEFEKWAKFYKHFFINQLTPLSHKEGMILTDEGYVEVVLGTSIPVQTSVKLEYIHEMVITPMHQYSFSNINDNEVVFSARLPRVGFYNFKLFASKLTNASVKSYDIVAQYQLHSIKSNENCAPFPKVFSAWGPGYVLHEPRDGVLPAGQTVKFMIASSDAVEMHVCSSGGIGAWTELRQSSENLWENDVPFCKETTAATVVVKVKGQTSTTYTGVLKYTVQ